MIKALDQKGIKDSIVNKINAIINSKAGLKLTTSEFQEI